MAKLITVDGEIKDVTPKNKRKGFQLQELYDMLECKMVETVNLPDGHIMIVDEEGALDELAEMNFTASSIVGTYIFGNVLICDSNEFK